MAVAKLRYAAPAEAFDLARGLDPRRRKPHADARNSKLGLAVKLVNQNCE